jgi:NAD(P)-dependent dehydrogenase (short-subunit alcohol dehydrogenase family)
MTGQAKLLQGKWVLVTGASRGIGQAIAMAYAEEGEAYISAVKDSDHLMCMKGVSGRGVQLQHHSVHRCQSLAGR